MMVAIALLAALLSLSPGVNGPFLLDDIHNLQPMGMHGGLSNPETFNRFVWGNTSGPFGRPLAMLTFVPNADTWPAAPFAFKATNIALHLLLGGLIFGLMLKLFRLGGVGASAAPWLAAFVAALWLLHPIQSSNVLYVIQRMTQLSAIFMVVAALAWLRGRDELLAGRTRSAYLWMTLGLAVPGVLGLLSKENVVVLPLLILALLLTVAPVPKQHRTPAWTAWLVVFLAVPIAAICVQFGRYLLYEGGFANRPFDAWQRLSIQGLVLWDYVANVIWPRVAPTLFYDHWDIRAVTTAGWIRVASYAAWAALLALACWFRRRQPLLALAVFAFLALHVLEAGPVSLEIYFQHRNYLAMAFVLMGLVYAAHLAVVRWRVPYAVLPAAGAIVLVVFMAMLYRGSSLWGDNEQLRQHWVSQQPESLRAHHHLVMRAFVDRDWQEARRRIHAARAAHPDASTTAFYEVFYACEHGIPMHGPMSRLQAAADSDWRRTDTAASLRQLATLIEIHGCAGGDVGLALALADRFLANPHYQARPEQRKLLSAQFTIHRRVGNYEAADAIMRDRALRENSEAYWMEYARFKESMGRYAEAAKMVEKAEAAGAYRALGNYLASDRERQARLGAERERLEALAEGRRD